MASIKLISLIIIPVVLLMTSYSHNIYDTQRDNIKKENIMIFIYGGYFNMGSDDEDCSSDCKPQHRVYLNDYYISKYEVTYKEFIEFLNTTGVSIDGTLKGKKCSELKKIIVQSNSEMECFILNDQDLHKQLITQWSM